MAGNHDDGLYLATCAGLPRGDADTHRLARHLQSRGVTAHIVVWDDPDVDWSRAPLTVIRSTWDYHTRHAAFVQWADRVPRLENPASLVRWNATKRYLLDLPDSIPTIPTHLLEDPDEVAIRHALEDLDWSRSVLKPAVGLDGHGVRQITRDAVEARRYPGTWLLQPFVEEAATEGETSVIVIDGRPTHAVRRSPPAGDFRAQERLGGRVEACKLTDELAAFALSAVAWLKPAPLYARVDTVPRGGALTVMELELIEPSLFLQHSRDALSAMADALHRLLAAGDGA